jgi:uncharacterized protein YcbX
LKFKIKILLEPKGRNIFDQQESSMDSLVNALVVICSLYFIFNYFYSQKSKTKLKKIIVYPVKSCRGFEVKNWKIETNGLQYDREFMIVNSKQKLLSPKKNPRLSMIQTSIEENFLILTFKEEKLKIDLKDYPKKKISIKIIGQSVESLIYENKEINNWISKVLLEECYFVRRDPDRQRNVSNEKVSNFGFSNYSPFMMVSEASIDDLISKWKGSDFDSVCERLRPNFVFNGEFEAFSEDQWISVNIGKFKLNCVQKCSRSVNINVDPRIGVFTKEPFNILSFRKSEVDGEIYFGILAKPDVEIQKDLKISTEDYIKIEEPESE